jgi:hypothetical protein
MLPVPGLWILAAILILTAALVDMGEKYKKPFYFAGIVVGVLALLITCGVMGNRAAFWGW